jgi:hypothetical protein
MAHLGSSVVVGEAPVNRTQPLSLVVVMMIHLEWATLGYRFFVTYVYITLLTFAMKDSFESKSSSLCTPRLP